MYVDYVELGKRIAARRKALGLKQNKVNEMAGLSDKYLSNIETARSIPSIDVLMKICTALDTTPDSLLMGAVNNDEASQTDKLVADKIHRLNKRQKDFVIEFIDWLSERDI